MRAFQLLVAGLRGQPPGVKVPWTRAEAPAPAQPGSDLGGRIEKRETKAQVPLLTRQRAYGMLRGAGYAGLRGRSRRRRPSRAPPSIRAGRAPSSGQLMPLGLSEPQWEYRRQEIALGLSYRPVHGVGVAAVHAALGGA